MLFVIIFCSFMACVVIKLAMPLPIMVQKSVVALTQNSDNFPDFISSKLPSLLSEITSWQNASYYPTNDEKIDPLTWRGTGASTYNQQFFMDDIERDISNLKNGRYIKVGTQTELITVLQKAVAGDTIEILSGTYSLPNAKHILSSAGNEDLPIKLLAGRLGKVILYLSGEGIVVDQPHWHFQNLHLIGQCEQHSSCEHAFHVVGKGQHTHFINNIFQDFNAAIKINGLNNDYPDSGVITKNTFYNTSSRQTSKPVTPIDLMHANNWQVSENFIFDFVKSGGNNVSYGAFFKGGSTGGEFFNNLIMCQANLTSPFSSVGLSFGGGGSDVNHRRDSNAFEHKAGIMRNNIIMHCANDVGIYVNNATDSLIEHNTLYKTLGIDVRFESTATITNNIISGRIKEREGGQIVAENNIIFAQAFLTARDALDDLFVLPIRGNFNWQLTPLLPSNNDTKIKTQRNDFCNKPTSAHYLGAYAGDNFCLEKMNLLKQ